MSDAGDPHYHSLLAFGYLFTVSDGSRTTAVVLPWWAPPILFALLPSCWLGAHLRRRQAMQRQAKGQCAFCGYDRRYSPGCCPECGGATLKPVADTAPVYRLAVVIFLAVMLLLVGVAWYSNPTRAVALRSTAAGPRMECPVWEPPQHSGLRRLFHHNTVWNRDWYQAFWNSPSSQLLVVVQTPIDRGGLVTSTGDWPIYEVIVLDRSMNLIRRGTISALGHFPLPNAVPWCLAEIRSDDNHLPEVYRGRWNLAVAVVFEADFQPSSPVQLVGGTGAEAAEAINPGYLEPIEWDDVPEKFACNIPLDAVKEFDVRPAEPQPPTAIGMVRRAAYRLPEERSTCSAKSTVQTVITFQNATGKPVQLCWLDFGGRRHYYHTLAPAESYEQRTFVGHVWVATDDRRDAFALYRATTQPQTIMIALPQGKRDVDNAVHNSLTRPTEYLPRESKNRS